MLCEYSMALVCLGFIGVYYLTRKPNKRISIELLAMDVTHKRQFLNSFDFVLSDINGVIWLTQTPLPGAATAVNMLQDDKKKVVLISNNSLKTESDYKAALTHANIAVPTDNVMFPSKAAILYLKQQNFTETIFVIGMAVIRQAFTDAGFSVVYEKDNKLLNNLDDIYETISLSQKVGAVYIDTDFNVSYLKMLKASLFLQNPNCLFIIGPTDARFPFDNDTRQIPSPIPMYKFIEKVTNRKATIVGKPSLILKDIVMKKYGINDAKRVLFIGDSLSQDVGFGRMCGFKTLLVLTGTTSRNNLFTHDKPNELPDYYLNSLSDLSVIYDDTRK